MPLDLTLPADFKCQKPYVEYSSTYVASTPTVGPSFNANLNKGIGVGIKYTGPNSEFRAGISHIGSGSNTYTIGATFRF